MNALEIKRFAIAGVLAFISACASSPELSKLETPLYRSEILPKGVASYYLIAGIGLNSDSDSDAYVFPIYWEHGVSERLTLVWMPLPLGIRYLLSAEARRWTWIEGDLLGYVYAQQRVFLWRPSASVTHKWLFSDKWGAHLGLFLKTEVDRGPFSLSPTLGARFGAETQPFDWLFVSASLLPMVEKGETRASYLGGAPASSLGHDSPSRFRLPLEFRLSVQKSMRWKAEARLTVYRIGYESGYLGLPLFLSVSHFW